MTTSSFYITTAIDYSNGEPHIGHAYEKIGADCVARYQRLRGRQVHFSIGMDEHGQKVAQSAEAQGIDPQAWVDRIAESFQQAWQELRISHTDFIRTTEARHQRAVEELFRRIERAGHLSEGTYEGYYCVGCEGFKLEKDLRDGQCPVHPTRDIKWLEEPNYFFEIGRFRQALLDLYESRPDFVEPRAKYNEIYNVVSDWDDDQQLSVSRARVPWGIPWPGDPSHTVYVWFDALINYLSASGFPEGGFEEVWPADVHVIGPDILRFHAAMWPAMLMAADLAVPRKIWCHGWVNTEGARFSKSAGVRITLRDSIDRYGPDALRYFLLREIPWDGDGNFTSDRFDVRYTAELADGYGNLVSRVLAMIRQYLDSTTPEAPTTQLDTFGRDVVDAYRDAMDSGRLHQGADELWRLVDRANAYVEERAPWTQAKEERQHDLEETLGSLARALARITLMLSPFIPEKTAAVWTALGLSGTPTDVSWSMVEDPRCGGSTIGSLSPLFPKRASNS